MKALIWIFRVLLALVLAVLIAISGALLFSSRVREEDPPVLLGYAPFTVDNGDMAPSLYPGDLAVLRMGPESQPGDIVAFRSEGKLVLRRVVGTSEEKYITQQEAFGQPDVDLLDPARVEAVCVTYLPGCGAAVAFLYSPAGLVVLALLALLLLVAPALLTRGAARPEGPLVDYGYDVEEAPPRPRQPSRRQTAAPAPRRESPAQPRRIPPSGAPESPQRQASPRSGNGRYKARH